MSAWLTFIIGLIVGWLAEWVIDWLFWRRQGETAAASDWQIKFNKAEATIRDLERQLQNALNREPEVVVKEVAVIKEKDQLEKIHGIGKVFAARFNEAGIYTFADLAALSPERAREIINPEEWQAIEPEAWIAGAAQLVSKKRMN